MLDHLSTPEITLAVGAISARLQDRPLPEFRAFARQNERPDLVNHEIGLFIEPT